MPVNFQFVGRLRFQGASSIYSLAQSAPNTTKIHREWQIALYAGRDPWRLPDIHANVIADAV
jgi:hypothetical protein